MRGKRRSSSEQQEQTEADEGQDQPEAPPTLPTLEQAANQQGVYLFIGVIYEELHNDIFLIWTG